MGAGEGAAAGEGDAGVTKAAGGGATGDGPGCPRGANMGGFRSAGAEKMGRVGVVSCGEEKTGRLAGAGGCG